MIGARERAAVAGASAAEPRSTVATDVQERMHAAVAVAHHQDGVFTHVRGEEVTRVRNLAFVAEKQPDAREDPLQLRLVDVRINEDAATDEAVVGINQLLEV